MDTNIKIIEKAIADIESVKDKAEIIANAMRNCIKTINETDARVKAAYKDGYREALGNISLAIKNLALNKKYLGVVDHDYEPEKPLDTTSENTCECVSCNSIQQFLKQFPGTHKFVITRGFSNNINFITKLLFLTANSHIHEISEKYKNTFSYKETYKYVTNLIAEYNGNVMLLKNVPESVCNYFVSVLNREPKSLREKIGYLWQ